MTAREARQLLYHHMFGNFTPVTKDEWESTNKLIDILVKEVCKEQRKMCSKAVPHVGTLDKRDILNAPEPKLD